MFPSHGEVSAAVSSGVGCAAVVPLHRRAASRPRGPTPLLGAFGRASRWPTWLRPGCVAPGRPMAVARRKRRDPQISIREMISSRQSWFGQSPYMIAAPLRVRDSSHTLTHRQVLETSARRCHAEGKHALRSSVFFGRATSWSIFSRILNSGHGSILLR